jgi:hypothetical protein
VATFGRLYVRQSEPKQADNDLITSTRFVRRAAINGEICCWPRRSPTFRRDPGSAVENRFANRRCFNSLLTHRRTITLSVLYDFSDCPSSGIQTEISEQGSRSDQFPSNSNLASAAAGKRPSTRPRAPARGSPDLQLPRNRGCNRGGPRVYELDVKRSR